MNSYERIYNTLIEQTPAMGKPQTPAEVVKAAIKKQGGITAVRAKQKARRAANAADTESYIRGEDEDHRAQEKAGTRTRPTGGSANASGRTPEEQEYVDDLRGSESPSRPRGRFRRP